MAVALEVKVISIIVPTLNEELYIGKLIKLLKSQTLKDFEVIIVDGSSSDKTKEVVKKFSKKDKRIKLITSKKRNMSHQRNLGAKKAKFSRILFLDADVTIKKDFLKKSIDELQSRNLKVSGCYVVPLTDNSLDKVGHFFLNLWFFVAQYFYPHMVQCIFSTKKIHKSLGGFDEEIVLAEDNDYVNRSTKFTKFRILKSVKLYVSTRRFEQENRFFLFLKYILCPIYRIIFGEIRTNIFNYKMNIKHK